MPEQPYDIPRLQAQVSTVLGQCTAVADLYTGQIRDLVNGCLASCGSTWAGCESCVEGAVESKFIRAGTVAQKCVGKILDKAQAQFNRAQILAAPVINQLPELRDIVAAQMIGAAPAEFVPPPVSPDTNPNIQPRPPGSTCDQQPPGVTWMGCGGGGVNPPGNLPPSPCPPGTIAQWVQNGQGGWEPVCVPVPGTEPLPISTVCAVEPPPAPPVPPAPPPCPTPIGPCPEGTEWQWIDHAWRCRPKPPGEPPVPPGPGGGGMLDLFGLSNYNQIFCPELFARPAGAKLEDYVKEWDKLAINLTTAAFAPILDLVYLLNKQAGERLADKLWRAVSETIIPIGESVVRWLFLPRDCDYASIIVPAGVRATLSFVEHWLDLGLDDVITNLSYTISRACPTFLPSQPGTDSAWLAGKITDETWECWTRSINNLNVPAKAVRDANRNQPNAEQWIAASMRDIIRPDQLDEHLRGVGVIQGDEAEVFKRLMEQLPGPGDIVRFMLRDVADDVRPQGAVKKFSLDLEFEQKFDGLLKGYAKGQGLSTDLMRYYWRAHWEWPSASQLYEMLHRLRPDNNPRLQVTLPDVLSVLGINDVIPYFRERLAAISYRLPRLLDAYKLFRENKWGEPELLDYYQSYGYPLDVAQKKVQIDALKKNDEKYKLGALLTKSNVTNAFIGGSIGELEARLMLSKTLLGNDEIDRAIDHAKDLRVIALRKKIAKSIKCKFATCGINASEAVAELSAAGWDATDATYEVVCWKQQCGAKGKEATTAQLCKWFGLNLLSLADYRSRLYKLGWSRSDVERIIGECSIDLAKKASKNGKQPAGSPGN